MSIRQNKELQSLYYIWAEMIQRCENPKHKFFYNYGGRGITVCKQWRSDFYSFVKDMGKRPKKYTLERKNNDVGYFKENCCWADRHKQGLNRRLFKNNKTGLKGIEYRPQGTYRVRIRRYGKIIFDKTVGDFFEACCLKKSFELQECK